VSEAHLGLIRLQWWRDLVTALAAGEEMQDHQGTHLEMAHALKAVIAQQEALERYFNARTFDMQDQAHDDLAALLRYCTATGGTIAALKVIALNGLDKEKDAASLIGTAHSLIGLIRTLPYQARVGRCRVPREVRGHYNLDMADFHKGQCSDALKAIVRLLSDEAHRLIEAARALNAPTNAVLLGSVSAEDYLKRLKAAAYDPFSPHTGGGRGKRQLLVGWKAWRGHY